MTRRIPTWSEIVKAGDAFDLEPFKAMEEEAGRNPVDAEQAKTGSKVRVHEGYHSGAMSRFDPKKFVPVKNGSDGKLEPGTGFYFTDLGADGMSDYYHDHSHLYVDKDGKEIDHGGVAFTVDPKTHVAIRNANDYKDFLQKYHRFHNYGDDAKPVWGVLPDWEAAAAAGVGSVQFPYESLKNTIGAKMFHEYWDGPNGERGQPQYIYNHPNEGMVLRPEAVIDQRRYSPALERAPYAKDRSTEDRYLAGLTEDGAMFMDWMHGKGTYSPEDIKMWHGYVRRHPEKTLRDLHDVLYDWDGEKLKKNVKSAEDGSKRMTDYPEIPSWSEIAKAQTRVDTTMDEVLPQTLVDTYPDLNGKNVWQFGAEAGQKAEGFREKAQALGNTQMDAQKNYYDMASVMRRLHDKIPTLAAASPAVAPEAKAETPAAGTPSNLLQTHIDAHNKFDPDIWESASRNKQLLNNAIKHRDAFQANNIDGKEYSPTDMAKVRGSLDRLNRLVALKVDDYTEDMNAIRDVSEDADIFDAQRRMDTSTGQQE